MRLASPVSSLGPVDIGELVAWISAIDFAEWPQQEAGRPAMVSDPAWYGFGRVTDKLVESLSNGRDYQRMLSVVLPGHCIPTHRDLQNPDWCGRVHVPLTSNAQSKFIVGGIEYWLEPGMAYLVDTEVEHSVTNDGATPRIHFMFDLKRGS